MLHVPRQNPMQLKPYPAYAKVNSNAVCDEAKGAAAVATDNLPHVAAQPVLAQALQHTASTSII